MSDRGAERANEERDTSGGGTRSDRRDAALDQLGDSDAAPDQPGDSDAAPDQPGDSDAAPDRLDDSAGRRDGQSGGDPEYDVPRAPSITDRLLSGAADKPVLAVFVVVLLFLAAGFFVAGVLFVAELLSGGCVPAQPQ